MDDYLLELDKEIEQYIQDINNLKRNNARQEQIDSLTSFKDGLIRAKGIYKLVTQSKKLVNTNG